MGRTKRKRNGKRISSEFHGELKVIDLQKSMKLKCPDLKISYFKDTGRGIKCKRKIREGDTLIALPLTHLITINTNSELLNNLRVEDFGPEEILSIWLLYEAHLGKKSKHFDYIDCLPEYYTNLYFCTSEELKLLPEFMKKELLTQINKLEKSFKDLLKILTHKRCPHCGISLIKTYTREKYTWAWFAVNTRSVFYKDKSGAESSALAPFLDMFNHSSDANTQMIIDFQNGYYILKALVGYKKYDQVFIKYGSHCNLKLLLEYGFVTPDNPHDCVKFTFEEVIESVKELDLNYGELTKLKYRFIVKNKLNENLNKSKEEFSWNFHGLVYILITKDENISVTQSKVYSNDFNVYEQNIINKAGKIVAAKKFEEFRETLMKMEEIENCSESFKSVKNYIRISMKLLI